jgi:hypothetical protein
VVVRLFVFSSRQTSTPVASIATPGKTRSVPLRARCEARRAVMRCDSIPSGARGRASVRGGLVVVDDENRGSLLHGSWLSDSQEPALWCKRGTGGELPNAMASLELDATACSPW